MKGLIFRIPLLFLFISGCFLSSCEKERKQLYIVGSSTISPFAIIVGEHFAKKNQEMPIVEGVGTGKGMRLFCSDAGPNSPDIALASRQMTLQEKKSCQHNNIAFEEILIGYDSLVLVSSRDQDLSFSFTKKNIYQAIAQNLLYKKEMRINPFHSWNQLHSSFPSHKIHLIGPEPLSGSHDMLVESVMLPFSIKAGIDKIPEALSFRKDGVYVPVPDNDLSVLEKLRSQTGSVGFVTYRFFDKNERHLKAFPVDDRLGEPEAIASGKYPLSRRLFLYVKKKHLFLKPKLIDYLEEFLNGISPGVDGYLKEEGLILLFPREYTEKKEKLTAIKKTLKPKKHPS